jgi:hypothetical protein
MMLCSQKKIGKPVFFGIDNKENLNIWKFIAVVLNILWSLFLIKLEPDINPNPSHGNEDLFRGSKKTPAICVYNDAMFTEKDWEGIITIYNSVKEKEPLKVGRFGLGFKSVFHMTGKHTTVQ